METTAKNQKETFKVKGNWDVQAKELKKKYPKLTDSDVKFETFKEEDLLKRLQARLGKTREEVITIINELQPEKV